MDVVVPLKYLSNFCQSLDLSLINCEIKLDMRRTKTSVISEISRKFRAVSNADPPQYEVIAAPVGAAFQMIYAKIYVPVVTLIKKW